MQVLIAIALKSLLIAGLTLGLLTLMKRRSAAERSSVAHIGLLALLIMAFAPLALPTWSVEAPALLGQAPEAEAMIPTSEPAVAPLTAPVALKSVAPSSAPSRFSMSPVAAATALYALPAAILLFITLLALGRLIALRARADVLVNSHWLSALARAQRRMGFKHGTALLTSDDLSSPVSWGLMRPVILLNSRAVEASGEAEAIIAHELAHVARMDWAKLLLARVATALFWFNPLVWLLAREAHQLREEAADDAVLASDIADTDYATLLVGVARHECPGLLLGAHGVAPSKSSLARRVARVLDASSVRGPAARPFAVGVFAGAVLIAAPLAALTLTPGGPKLAKPAAAPTTKAVYRATEFPEAREAPADLPHIIASGVSTSVAAAAAAVSQVNPDETTAQVAADRADAERDAALERAAAAREAALQQAAAAREAALEGAQNTREQAMSYRGKDYAMRVVGVTPDYIAGIRSAAPQLTGNKDEDFITMKAIGVTPEYVRDLASAGLRNLSLGEIIHARAVGLTADYARGVAATGVRPTLEDVLQFRTFGITPEQIVHARRHGARTTRQIVDMVVTGELKRVGWPFEGPRPPSPPAPTRKVPDSDPGG